LENSDVGFDSLRRPELLLEEVGATDPEIAEEGFLVRGWFEP